MSAIYQGLVSLVWLQRMLKGGGHESNTKLTFFTIDAKKEFYLNKGSDTVRYFFFIRSPRGFKTSRHFFYLKIQKKTRERDWRPSIGRSALIASALCYWLKIKMQIMASDGNLFRGNLHVRSASFSGKAHQRYKSRLTAPQQFSAQILERKNTRRSSFAAQWFVIKRRDGKGRMQKNPLSFAYFISFLSL